MAETVYLVWVTGVKLSPYARPGQLVAVDGNDPRVWRFVKLGVLRLTPPDEFEGTVDDGGLAPEPEPESGSGGPVEPEEEEPADGEEGGDGGASDVHA